MLPTTQTNQINTPSYISPVDVFHENSEGRYFQLYEKAKESYRLYDAYKDQVFDPRYLSEILEQYTGSVVPEAVRQVVWKSLPKLDYKLDNFSKSFGVYTALNKTGLIADAVFNTYRSPMADKAIASDGSLWLEYLDRVFPDKSQQSTILDFLSHAFQRSEERPLWGVVLHGEQRCGKSTVMEILSRVVGRDYVFNTNKYNVLNGKFSSTLATKFFAGFEDLTPLVDNNDFKQFMTQPSAPLEMKGKDARMVPSQCRIIHSTNNDPFFVAGTLGKGETRYFIPDAIKHKVSPAESEEFFGRFYAWLENGGDAFISHFLRTYEISEAFSVQSPPLTATFKRWSTYEDPLISEVRSFIDNSGSPLKLFTLEDLRNGIDSAILYAYKEKDLLDILSGMGYQKYRTPPINGKRHSYWHHPSVITAKEMVANLRAESAVYITPVF